MNSFIAALPIALLVLACPLMMVGMGVAVWFIARVRGEKKPMSIGCMTGHTGDPQSTDANAESQLRQRIAQMEQEVTELRAQVQNDGASADGEDTMLARDRIR